MSNWSGPKYYVEMLENWERTGMIPKRGAPAQPAAPPKIEPKPSSPDLGFLSKKEAERGSFTPLGGKPAW